MGFIKTASYNGIVHCTFDKQPRVEYLTDWHGAPRDKQINGLLSDGWIERPTRPQDFPIDYLSCRMASPKTYWAYLVQYDDGVRNNQRPPVVIEWPFDTPPPRIVNTQYRVDSTFNWGPMFYDRQPAMWCDYCGDSLLIDEKLDAKIAKHLEAGKHRRGEEIKRLLSNGWVRLEEVWDSLKDVPRGNNGCSTPHWIKQYLLRYSLIVEEERPSNIGPVDDCIKADVAEKLKSHISTRGWTAQGLKKALGVRSAPRKRGDTCTICGATDLVSEVRLPGPTYYLCVKHTEYLQVMLDKCADK